MPVSPVLDLPLDRLLREGLRRATAGEPVARWLPYSLGLLGAATSPVEPALGPL